MAESTKAGSGTALRLRPQSALFRQGLIASLVFMLPVLAVLYVLTVPNGPWRLVLGVHILAAVSVTLASSAFFRSSIWVSPTGLRERGFFGRTIVVPIEQIGSIITAETFTGTGTDASPQLFVCDRDGKQLIRMRGQFWSRENMDILIATLHVPHKELDNVMSNRELSTDYPGLLYWFERRPVIAALTFASATALVGALALLVLNLLGVAV